MFARLSRVLTIENTKLYMTQIPIVILADAAMTTSPSAGVMITAEEITEYSNTKYTMRES
jgi:hypothetical protein